MKSLTKKLVLDIKHWIFCLTLLFLSPAQAIYDLNTHKEGVPSDVSGKYWLLVAQGCSSCDRVLGKLKTFCSGKLPPAKSIGFFVTGRSEKKMKEKLKDYKEYDIFSGTINEIYTTYSFQNTPSLLMKKGKIAVGEKGILKVLKKDQKFCLSGNESLDSKDAG